MTRKRIRKQPSLDSLQQAAQNVAYTHSFSDARIDEFIIRYERAHGECLSREEAREAAGRLFRLYRLIYSRNEKLDASPSSDQEDRTSL